MKFLPPILVVWFLLLLTGCPREIHPPAQPALTELEWSGIHAIAQLVEISREDGDDIWPGYRLHDRSFIIFQPGKRSFLGNAQVTPPKLQQISVKEIEVPVYVIPRSELKLSGGLPYVKDFEFASNRSLVARYNPGTTPERFYRLVVHETFHVYQQERFDRGSSSPACRYPYEDFENAYLARVEEVLLKRMLTRGVKKVSRRDLTLYLAVRSHRYGLEEGARAWSIEGWEETVEGTARYVEMRYAVAAGYAELEKELHQFVGYLSQFQPASLQKWKYYRTGASLGTILDALGFPEWKSECEKNNCLYPFAASELAEDVGELPDEAMEKRVAEFASERSATEQSLTHYLTRENKLLEQWSLQGKIRVTVRFAEKGHAYYSSRGTTFATDDCARFVSGILAFVDKKYGFEVRRRSVLFKNEDSGYWLQFHHDLKGGSGSIDDGRLAMIPGGYSFEREIQFQFPDFQLQFKGHGTVTVTKDALEIRLD